MNYEHLLDILVCPETKMDLTVAEPELIEKINRKIRSDKLSNRAGKKLTEKIDTGLLRKDGKYLYPIKDEIPIMLEEEGIAIESVGTA